MSQATAELQAMADAAFGALNAGDIEGFLALVTEDVEFTSMVAEMEATTFRGHDGVRTWWESVRGAFQAGPRWEVREMRGSGDGGILEFRMTGTLAGVQVGQTMWQAVRFREGRVAWWALFRTERDALEAAGLSE